MTSDAAFGALRSLASAWRGDWSEFDGRTLRAQLHDWIRCAQDDGTDWEQWLRLNDICPTCHSWEEYCYCKPKGEPEQRREAV